MIHFKKIRALFLILIFVLIGGVTVFAANKYSGTPDKIPEEVNKVVNSNFEKIVSTMKKNLDQDTNQVHENTKFTLGNVYKLHHLRGDIYDTFKTLDKFNDYFAESNEWLYIVNYDGKSSFYIDVAMIEGKYELAYFGGDAGAFDNTLMKNNDRFSNNSILFASGNEYYFVNEDGNTLMVPNNMEDYIKNKSDYDTPMEGTKLRAVIDNLLEKEIQRQKNGEPFIYGSTSFLKMYKEMYGEKVFK